MKKALKAAGIVLGAAGVAAAGVALAKFVIDHVALCILCDGECGDCEVTDCMFNPKNSFYDCPDGKEKEP